MQISRRQLLRSSLGGLLLATPLSYAADRIRMQFWSEDEATRIAIETVKEHKFSHSILRNRIPMRLVLDIEDMTLNAEIERTVREIKADRRYISSVRVGQYKPNVLRLVFELRKDVQTHVTATEPVSGIGPRIMIEIAPPDIDPMAHTIQSVPSSTSATNTTQGETRNEEAPGYSEPRAKSRAQRRAKKRKETLIVVIDPGHGGADPGAVGRRKTYEKDVVLSISKKLARRINATTGMKAVLTRDRDVFIPLNKRAGLAVKHRAHLFVSIHADAWTSPSAEGSSVFTLSVGGASSLQARWLAQSQNRSDAIGGTVFSDVSQSARGTVVDMLAEMKLRYGIELGDAVLEELAKIGSLHKNSVEYAEFAVLKAQGVPSILVETAFLSNPKEEIKLRDNGHQERLARAIFNGITKAVEQDPSLLKQT